MFAGMNGFDIIWQWIGITAALFALVVVAVWVVWRMFRA